MALSHLVLLILVVNGIIDSVTTASLPVKTILDPKRRSDIVDETFLEQKDVLLDMLESKLKEVRDKKKKKSENNNNNGEGIKCESIPKNVDLRVKSHGLISVGESDVFLKYGQSGSGTVNLDAAGISNIGKVHLELGVAEGGAVHIPGLNSLFVGMNCSNTNKTNHINREGKPEPQPDETPENDQLDTRRSKVNLEFSVHGPELKFNTTSNSNSENMRNDTVVNSTVSYDVKTETTVIVTNSTTLVSDTTLANSTKSESVAVSDTTASSVASNDVPNVI